MMLFPADHTTYLSMADSNFPEWVMHLEMLTSQLKIFVKAEKFNAYFCFFFFFSFKYYFYISYVTCV